MLFTLLLILHVIVAFVLVMSILLQTGGQGGGLSSAFGGGNQTLFGGRGAATFLSRATTYFGAGFLVLSFLLAMVQAHRTSGVEASRNIIQEQMAPQQAPAGDATGAPVSPPPTDAGTGAPQTESPAQLPGGAPPEGGE